MKYSCQVSVSSFDFERFEKVDRKIKDSFQRGSKNLLEVNGPLPLKRKEKLFTVNRSPHGNKKARDQFFLMQYKRLWLLQGQGIKASLFSSKILSVFRELSALEGISFSWTFSLKKLLEKKVNCFLKSPFPLRSPFSLVVRTSPFRGEDTRSIRVGDIIKRIQLYSFLRLVFKY